MKKKELPYTPIVALSGDDKEKLAEENMQLNFDDMSNC